MLVAISIVLILLGFVLQWHHDRKERKEGARTLCKPALKALASGGVLFLASFCLGIGIGAFSPTEVKLDELAITATNFDPTTGAADIFIVKGDGHENEYFTFESLPIRFEGKQAKVIRKYKSPVPNKVLAAMLFIPNSKSFIKGSEVAILPADWQTDP